MSLPNAIIAGAPKSGTTAVFEYLSGHPDVCPASKKETYYLIDEGYVLFNKNLNYHKDGVRGYEQYFSQCDGVSAKIFLEATPDYLYQQTPLNYIKELEVKPKIVFLLRAPAERVYSMFQFARNNMATIDKSLSFKDYIELLDSKANYLDSRPLMKLAVRHSQYEVYLEKWYELLGSSNIKIILFEDMIRDTKKEMKNLCAFLDIDTDYFDKYEFNKSNETYLVKYQWLHRVMRKIYAMVKIGAVRKLFKRVYLAFNVSQGRVEKSEADIQAIEDLRQRFTETYRCLESDYGLDLKRWMGDNRA